MDGWIVRPFTVEEKLIEDAGVKAKAEFLGLQEGNTCGKKFSGFCSGKE
jgi:hypothetical protein